MSLGTYIYKMRGLMNLKRYQNLFLFKQRSVAEHSWSVSKIAHYLGKLENDKFGNPVDMGVLLQKGLFHDDIELYTGDILSHTKRMSKLMKKAVTQVENMAFENNFTKIIPSEWQNDYKSHILHAKDGTLEGDILHASDIIDTILESVEEIKLGNREDFDGILVEVTEKLLEMDLLSVKYFLKYDLEKFGLDIQPHYGDKVYEYIQSIENV
ncbi:hydrolase of HD superfamily-like protein [Bacillus sp. M6-12]|uniref:YfbR-like 5'-deoxynucleotidase n=1 Tax=Bacillus sp. M6-12 TaxID=2054166 RepID=UPI000C75C4C9|nr:YfbR-like 5'-deoxynucleotidase [Bacillus sp. M6-12]PLS15074.1 hydrolase of HD superfamily-like protein [Bacillus sp. M6-12]